ncbi:MAG: hypothetical protein JSV65_03570, partial [Armatimonadota bacterium]
YPGVFLTSAAILMLQIALTRLFSFTLWYHFAYVVISLALLGYGASGAARLVIRPDADGHTPYRLSCQKTMQGGQQAVALIRPTQGPILSEDTGLLHIAGRPILLDPDKMTSISHDRTWDQRPLLKDVKRRCFALIITQCDPLSGWNDRWGPYGNYRFSVGMARAIMENYYLVRQAGLHYILRPLDGKHPSCATPRRKLVADSR